MAPRDRRAGKESRTQNAPAEAGSVRLNKYFVPRDGIEREVITSDICRYLGNDALVRPGNYEVSEQIFYDNNAHGNAESSNWQKSTRLFHRSSQELNGGMVVLSSICHDFC